MNKNLSATELSASIDPVAVQHRPVPIAVWTPKFRLSKSVLDFSFAIIAVPLIAIVSLVLLCLNPFFNPGRLFFRQDRMGLGFQKFRLVKFVCIMLRCF